MKSMFLFFLILLVGVSVIAVGLFLNNYNYQVANETTAYDYTNSVDSKSISPKTTVNYTWFLFDTQRIKAEIIAEYPIRAGLYYFGSSPTDTLPKQNLYQYFNYDQNINVDVIVPDDAEWTLKIINEDNYTIRYTIYSSIGIPKPETIYQTVYPYRNEAFLALWTGIVILLVGTPLALYIWKTRQKIARSKVN